MQGRGLGLGDGRGIGLGDGRGLGLRRGPGLGLGLLFLSRVLDEKWCPSGTSLVHMHCLQSIFQL